MFFDNFEMPTFDEATYFHSEMAVQRNNSTTDFSSYHHLGLHHSESASRFSPVHVTSTPNRTAEFEARNATVNRRASSSEDDDDDQLSQQGNDEDFEFDESSLFDEDSIEKYHHHEDDDDEENESEKPTHRATTKTTRYQQTPNHRPRGRLLSNCPFQAASLPVQINAKNTTMTRSTTKVRSNNTTTAFEDPSVMEPSSLATYQGFCGRRDVEIPENIPPPDQMFLWMQELTRRTYGDQSELIFGELPPPRTRKGAARHHLATLC